MAYQHDGAQYWRRPGKDTGISASAGKCRGQIGGDLLHVFTSNWPPFLANETLSKFDAYAKLTHAGSHAEAARALARQGYGSDPTSDPAALLEPYTAAVEGPAKEVAKMAFRMRNPHELSPLAPDLVAAVTANMPELARLLARKRVDLASVDPEQTTRRYVSALVCAGVRMRWDPERVVHLVVHWMLTHKLLSELDRLDPKALAEAHAYFAANPHAEDSAGVIEIEVKREDETAAETGADPRDASLDYLRSALKIPIVRVLKSDREDSRYALEIETDPGVTERVEIGTWNAVRVAASFERPIVDRIGVLLPAAATKGASWRKVQIHLLRVVEVEDNDWRKRSEDEELVRDYLEGQTLGDDSGDPERTSWRVSHLAKAPFRRDGRLYLNAASLRAHLSIHRILGVEVRPMLRRLGYRHEQVVSWDPDAGHSVCRSYWSVSCDDVS